MGKQKQVRLIMPVIAAIIAGGMFLQDSIAGDIRTTSEVIQSNFSLNGDVESYQIQCKEYGEGYKSYYKIVREKIVQKLRHNCRDYFSKGDIKVLFILNSNGKLNGIVVDTGKSSGDKGLINIVLLSLQQAAPFPPFPEELNVPKLPFSVIVAFKDTN